MLYVKFFSLFYCILLYKECYVFFFKNAKHNVYLLSTDEETLIDTENKIKLFFFMCYSVLHK